MELDIRNTLNIRTEYNNKKKNFRPKHKGTLLNYNKSKSAHTLEIINSKINQEIQMDPFSAETN